DQAQHVVVHDERREPTEAAEPGLGAVTAREHLMPVLEREGDPHAPSVCQAARQVVAERERGAGHAVASVKPRAAMNASKPRAAWRRMARGTGGAQPSNRPLMPSA